MPSYTSEIILLPSAVRAATTYSADFINETSRALTFFFDVTAVDGATTVQLIIQGKDAISGKYVNISSGTVQAVVNTTAVQFLGTAVGIRTMRAQVLHTGGGNFTYSVGASMGS